MEDLMKDLSFEEMEEFSGGYNDRPNDGGGGGYYSDAQCFSFLAACTLPKKYGCIAARSGCTLYNTYCK